MRARRSAPGSPARNPTDAWVGAVWVKPGNKKVVHHVLARIKDRGPKDHTGSNAMFVGWAGSPRLLAASSQQLTVREYRVPAGSHPHDVAPARDGTVWYTDQRNSYIGRLDPESGDNFQIMTAMQSFERGGWSLRQAQVERLGLPASARDLLVELSRTRNELQHAYIDVTADDARAAVLHRRDDLVRRDFRDAEHAPPDLVHRVVLPFARPHEFWSSRTRRTISTGAARAAHPFSASSSCSSTPKA